MNQPESAPNNENNIGFEAVAPSSQKAQVQVFGIPTWWETERGEYIIESYVLWAISIIIIAAIIKSTFNNKLRSLYYYIPILSVINILEAYLYYKWWHYEASFIPFDPGTAQSGIIICLLAYNPIFLYILVSIIINIIAWATLMIALIRAMINIEGSRILTERELNPAMD